MDFIYYTKYFLWSQKTYVAPFFLSCLYISHSYLRVLQVFLTTSSINETQRVAIVSEMNVGFSNELTLSVPEFMELRQRERSLSIFKM